MFVEVLWPAAASHANQIDQDQVEMLSQLLENLKELSTRSSVSMDEHQYRLLARPNQNSPQGHVFSIELSDLHIFLHDLVFWNSREQKNVSFGPCEVGISQLVHLLHLLALAVSHCRNKFRKLLINYKGLRQN